VISGKPPIRRGVVCWATVPAGFGHDQGTRPWLVLSVAGPQRAIALPISSERPKVGYPLSWPVPATWGFDRPSWVRLDHIRSLPAERLRDPFAEASRVELEEVLDAVGELLGVTIKPR
jgi:mRNA-degrading endonuclease toxin of MazEF toxin-antitoxin module